MGFKKNMQDEHERRGEPKTRRGEHKMTDSRLPNSCSTRVLTVKSASLLNTGDYASAVKGVFVHAVSKAATPRPLPDNERMSQLDPEPPGCTFNTGRNARSSLLAHWMK